MQNAESLGHGYAQVGTVNMEDVMKGSSGVVMESSPSAVGLLADIDDQVARLFKQLAVLEDRIGACIVPHDGADDAVATPSRGVEILDNLESKLIRLTQLMGRLESLTDRVRL